MGMLHSGIDNGISGRVWLSVAWTNPTRQRDFYFEPTAGPAQLSTIRIVDGSGFLSGNGQQKVVRFFPMMSTACSLPVVSDLAQNAAME
jgi:hypothetical protein